VGERPPGQREKKRKVGRHSSTLGRRDVFNLSRKRKEKAKRNGSGGIKGKKKSVSDPDLEKKTRLSSISIGKKKERERKGELSKNRFEFTRGGEERGRYGGFS